MFRQSVTRPLVLAVGLVLAGCGGADPRTVEPAVSTVADPGPAPTAPPAELPGEPIDLYPYEGAELAVVGVAVDDTLSMRTGPGTEFAVLFELAPLADEFQATGHNRTLGGRALWVEVLVDGRSGWVNGRFVAHPGQTTDVTSELGGTVRAGTIAELAAAVAEVRSPESERGPDATVTVVDGPVAGDLDEIVVDVLGLADDAQRGERLHVFAVADAAGFTVRTVEATALCARGATADRSCL